MESKKIKFNFTDVFEDDAINLNGRIPIFEPASEYGFVSQTAALPPREVNTAKIVCTASGFEFTETEDTRFRLTDTEGTPIPIEKSTNHNFGGMVFRIQMSAGAYHIQVETVSTPDDSVISISGMCGAQLLLPGYWNAAKTIPIKHTAVWNDHVWSYDYVSGNGPIDIEIEPLASNVPVTVCSITLTPLPICMPEETPSVFLLGDSTVKSYIFEEAPMCGWGQLFSRLFDDSKVKLWNYSQGGRSLKSMFTEGRLNNLLLEGKKGDFILLQSGHNDESEDAPGVICAGEAARFGRGSTEEMYRYFLEEVFIPAIHSRGMIPILVTPVTRINGDAEEGTVISDSFTKRKFPQVMRRFAQEYNLPLLDLNRKSVEYVNSIGIASARGIYMSMEPGESPAHMANGSFANGNPQNRCDSTHYKEAMGNQCCRMLLEEMFINTDHNVRQLLSYARSSVQQALKAGDWSTVYPELCVDTLTGGNSYYRNQIEKILQLNVLKKDEKGCFNPQEPIHTKEFVRALAVLWQIDLKIETIAKDALMTREVMAAVVYDAYAMRFGLKPENKPLYMTQFNIQPSEKEKQPLQFDSYVKFDELEDAATISPMFFEKVKNSYELGLIRSEKGIVRGKCKNGTELCPNEVVSRAKAAKELYFLWVLSQDVHKENHIH